MSIFGRIISDDQMEDATLALLQKWLPTYLSEVERQVGLDAGYYVRPRSWEVRNDFEKWPEDMLPAIIVISIGLNDTPAKEGRGKIRAPFNVGVAAVVSSNEQENSRRMAYRYAAAIRAVMIQHQSLDGALDGAVRGVNWIDGRNNEMPAEAGRTLWASRQVFSIEVDEILTQGAGPVSPDADPLPDSTTPHPDWPVVPDKEHVQVSSTITKEPING